MRPIVILSCLLGFTAARPDVSLGYKYSVGNSDNYAGSTPLFTDSGNALSSSNGGLTAPGISFNSASSFATNAQSLSTASGNSFDASYDGHRTSYEADSTPIITKNFYIHAAPEEPEEEQQVKRIVVGRPTKNYKVLFIKAPVETPRAPKLEISYAPNEDKTVVYVLSKKTDQQVQVSEVVNPHPTQPTKPDVFFIKYKTQEEALHAQHQIQAKYDTLGGSSRVSNEGIAPVTSVIGSLGSSHASSSGTVYSQDSAHREYTNGAFSTASGIQSGQSSVVGGFTYGTPPQQTYLPPIH